MAVIVNKEEEGQGGVSEVQLPSTQQVAQQDFRNRFKIVKVETTEPLKRGRWTCFDFVDKPAAKDKAATTAPECGSVPVGDKAAKAAAVPSAATNVATAAATGGQKIVSSRPASSMARELGPLLEAAATTATSAATGEEGMAGQPPPVRQATAAAGGGGIAPPSGPDPLRPNAPVGVAGGVVFNNTGGNYAAAAAGPAMNSGTAVQQQQLQQPQVSPPVTTLPQVFINDYGNAAQMALSSSSCFD